MKDFKIRTAPILPTVKEIIVANSLWEQGNLSKNNLPRKPAITITGNTNCDKRNIGSNGGFGYKSQFDDMDIALMDSALLAHWAC